MKGERAGKGAGKKLPQWRTLATCATAAARVGLKSLMSIAREWSSTRNVCRSMPRCTLARDASSLQARPHKQMGFEARWREQQRGPSDERLTHPRRGRRLAADASTRIRPLSSSTTASHVRSYACSHAYSSTMPAADAGGVVSSGQSLRRPRCAISPVPTHWTAEPPCPRRLRRLLSMLTARSEIQRSTWRRCVTNSSGSARREWWSGRFFCAASSS